MMSLCSAVEFFKTYGIFITNIKNKNALTPPHIKLIAVQETKASDVMD